MLFGQSGGKMGIHVEKHRAESVEQKPHFSSLHALKNLLPNDMDRSTPPVRVCVLTITLAISSCFDSIAVKTVSVESPATCISHLDCPKTKYCRNSEEFPSYDSRYKRQPAACAQHESVGS